MDWIMNWWWATIVGPVVLAAAIGYALLKQRRLSPAEKDHQDAAVNSLYGDPAGRSSPAGEERQVGIHRPTATAPYTFTSRAFSTPT